MEKKITHPINFNTVTEGIVPALSSARIFRFIIVTNFQRAFSPIGVSSVVHVLREIVPSGPPVARTPSREYSRSWNAREVIGRKRFEKAGKVVRSKVAMGRALIVCKHSLVREQVAT